MIIGLDPGKHGAFAVISEDRLCGVSSLFNKTPHDLLHEFDALKKIARVEVEVFIEQVHASPQMGVTSAFTFGRNYGMLVTVATMFFKRIHFVRPQDWQAALGCLSQGNKTKLFEFAKKEFPAEYKEKIFNRESADAVLIALYGANIVKWKSRVY